MADELALKWGTLKRWKIESDEAKEALDRYRAEPAAYGAAQCHDSDTQKQALCDLCDIVEKGGNKIYLDWDGEWVDAAKAKEYILSYGKD